MNFPLLLLYIKSTFRCQGLFSFVPLHACLKEPTYLWVLSYDSTNIFRCQIDKRVPQWQTRMCKERR